jgi:hypothetical protein
MSLSCRNSSHSTDPKRDSSMPLRRRQRSLMVPASTAGPATVHARTASFQHFVNLCCACCDTSNARRAIYGLARPEVFAEPSSMAASISTCDLPILFSRSWYSPRAVVRRPIAASQRHCKDQGLTAADVASAFRVAPNAWPTAGRRRRSRNIRAQPYSPAAFTPATPRPLLPPRPVLLIRYIIDSMASTIGIEPATC